MEYWHSLEREVRDMKIKALLALADRLSPQGRAEFDRLYSDGVGNIRSDGAFELAFDDAERILKREGKDGGD